MKDINRVVPILVLSHDNDKIDCCPSEDKWNEFHTFRSENIFVERIHNISSWEVMCNDNSSPGDDTVSFQF